jgi:hypothetical protein
MPFPTDWATGTVKGHLITIGGSNANGEILFEPVPDRLQSPSEDYVVLPEPIAVNLTLGAFNVDIPASDDPDVNPTGWTYQVTELINGREPVSYYLEVPAGGTIDLADIAFIDSSTGQVTLKGDDGAGVEPGGTTGQVLAKASNTDFDTQWVDPGSGVAPHAATHTTGGLDEITVTEAQVTGLTAALAAKAPTASPTFTGVVTVPNSSFTLGKIVDMTSARLVGRSTAGAGPPEVITAAQAKTILALIKDDVGLALVDNTSDANKPVSTAQQAALNLKANLASPTFTGTVGGITKAMVGLSSVDNVSAASLRDRSTHTGTQPSTTISDWTEAVQDVVGALLSGTTGVTVTYDDSAGTLTIAGGGAGGLDAEAVRDTIGVALLGTGNITVTPNDALDTITISTTATVNSTDAALRDRATHTGTQSLSTTTDDTASTGRLALTNAERSKLINAPADTNVALNLKANLASPTFTGTVTVPNASFSLAKLADITSQRLLGRNTAGAGAPEVLTAADAKSILALVKGDVGLGNVDNTSDANKPISTATQAALDAKVDDAEFPVILDGVGTVANDSTPGELTIDVVFGTTAGTVAEGDDLAAKASSLDLALNVIFLKRVFWNNQAGNYVLVSTDAEANKVVCMTAGTTLTVPPEASVNWPDNATSDGWAVVNFLNLTGSTVTLTEGAAVNITSLGSLLGVPDGGMVTLMYRGSNNWHAVGSLV